MDRLSFPFSDTTLTSQVGLHEWDKEDPIADLRLASTNSSPVPLGSCDGLSSAML